MPGEKLKAYLDANGIKHSAIARLLGITRTAFMYKLQGKIRFNSDDIKLIANSLRLTDKEVRDIFLS